jgi:hypothetical protein
MPRIEEFIEWSPVKRLSWEDYLAKPSSASDVNQP